MLSEGPLGISYPRVRREVSDTDNTCAPLTRRQICSTITLVDRITNRTPHSKNSHQYKITYIPFILDIGNPGDQSA